MELQILKKKRIKESTEYQLPVLYMICKEFSKRFNFKTRITANTPMILFLADQLFNHLVKVFIMGNVELEKRDK